MSAFFFFELMGLHTAAKARGHNGPLLPKVTGVKRAVDNGMFRQLVV